MFQIIRDMSENEELEKEEMNTESNPEVSAEEAAEETLSGGADLEAQLAEEKAKYVRLYAEFENFRRRSAKEKLELIGTSTADLMKDVLPVVDDFQRAIEVNKSVEDIKAIKEGFELLYNKLFTILSSKGLKVLDSKGEDFDPENHEAVAQVPASEKKLKGKVIEEIEKGYTLNDKIIRHPKVVVGS